MEEKALSVIIPAYNAAGTLERAVASLISSVYNVEILIVENGSTDNTVSVASELEQKYASVRLLHSEKGVSRARNKGIQEAKGCWITFVDADDYLTKDGLETVMSDVNDTDVDLYVYGYEVGKRRQFLDMGGRTVYQEAYIEQYRIRMLENPTKGMQVWSKLFQRSIMIKHGIYFNENLSLAEDSDFVLRYSRYCQRICVNDTPIYHYSLDCPSTMRRHDGKKLEYYLQSMQETGKVIQEESQPVQKAFNYYVLMHMNIALVREVFCVENPDSFFKKVSYMKELVQKNVFQKAIQRVELKKCTSLRMLPVLMVKWHFFALGAVVYYLRARQNAAREQAK